MPTLAQSLHSHDLGHLRIIAQLWGVDLLAKERGEAYEELAELLLEGQLVNEVIDALPTEARNALNALAQREGRMPWVAFIRRFGEAREVGPGHRDREEIHLNPISTTEVLYYRALLARAFFDSSSGAQEFAYLPDELLEIIRAREEDQVAPEIEFGHLAHPDQRARVTLADDHLLDDMTTVIAALRLGWDEPPFPLDTSLDFILDLFK